MINEAEQKANELIDRFRPHSKTWDCFNDVELSDNHDIQSTIICVEEIMEYSCWVSQECQMKNQFMIESTEEFWQQVLQILKEKL